MYSVHCLAPCDRSPDAFHRQPARAKTHRGINARLPFRRMLGAKSPRLDDLFARHQLDLAALYATTKNRETRAFALADLGRQPGCSAEQTATREQFEYLLRRCGNERLLTWPFPSNPSFASSHVSTRSRASSRSRSRGHSQCDLKAKSAPNAARCPVARRSRSSRSGAARPATSIDSPHC